MAEGYERGHSVDPCPYDGVFVLGGFGETLDVHDPQDFADWLESRGAEAREIWPVIYKKSSGKQTVTYPQLVEVAIRYGWIDVLEKTVDQERYAVRFMPRRKKSNWTETNRAIARRLLAEGRMTEAGVAVLPEDMHGAAGS